MHPLASLRTFLAMFSSINPLGFPTMMGSRFVDPRMAPTIDPFPAHSCASVRCVTASGLVPMNMQPSFSLRKIAMQRVTLPLAGSTSAALSVPRERRAHRMHRVAYWIL